MPTYRYLALTPDGQKRRDMLQADSERQARQQLRDLGLFPRQLTPVTAQNTRSSRKTKISTEQLSLLTRQLATLVEAGIPLGDALNALAEQADKTSTRSLMIAIVERVREGYSLADSLKAHPSTFSPLYCALVAAGEKAGRLAQVLERLADHLERNQQQRQKARTALIYPLVLICVCIAVVIGLMTYVVPKLAAQFERSDMALPMLTQCMISLSKGLQHWGPALAIVLLIMGLLGRKALQYPTVRARWDQQLLRLPRLGELLKLLDTARLTRTLAILTRSGIDLLEALKVSRDTLGNQCMRTAVEQIRDQVATGVALNKAIAQTGYFSPTLRHMIASGEASGQLDTMLERIAVAQETTFNRRVDTALALFEPLLILTMGGIVLTIVLSILLPIMRLNGAMHM